MDKELEFFKSLIDGVENSNHAAEQSMAKAYLALFPSTEINNLKTALGDLIVIAQEYVPNAASKEIQAGRDAMAGRSLPEPPKAGE